MLDLTFQASGTNLSDTPRGLLGIRLCGLRIAEISGDCDYQMINESSNGFKGVWCPGVRGSFSLWLHV